jgi:hypothetical protein
MVQAELFVLHLLSAFVVLPSSPVKLIILHFFAGRCKFLKKIKIKVYTQNTSYNPFRHRLQGKKIHIQKQVFDKYSTYPGR